MLHELQLFILLPLKLIRSKVGEGLRLQILEDAAVNAHGFSLVKLWVLESFDALVKAAVDQSTNAAVSEACKTQPCQVGWNLDRQSDSTAFSSTNKARCSAATKSMSLSLGVPPWKGAVAVAADPGAALPGPPNTPAMMT